MQTVSYNVGSNAIFPIIPSSPSWQANTSLGCDQPLSYLVQIIANLCAQMMQNEKMNENCRFYQHQKPFFKTFCDMTFCTITLDMKFLYCRCKKHFLFKLSLRVFAQLCEKDSFSNVVSIKLLHIIYFGSFPLVVGFCFC